MKSYPIYLHKTKKQSNFTTNLYHDNIALERLRI